MNEPMNDDDKMNARASAVQAGKLWVASAEKPPPRESISEREAGRREVLAELARAACALPGTSHDRTPGIAWLVNLGIHFQIDVDSMLAAQPPMRNYARD